MIYRKGMFWFMYRNGQDSKRLPSPNHIIYNVDNLVDCLHISHNLMPAMKFI